MSEPWKHPKTGKWWFRRATPRDLYEAKEKLIALGFTVTREVKRSLNTSIKKDAQGPWSSVNAEWESKWKAMRDALRAEPTALTTEQVFAIVAEVGRDVHKAAKANPGSRERWLRLAEDARTVTIGNEGREKLWSGLQRHIAKRYGLHSINNQSRQHLMDCFIAELGDTANELAALAGGDYSEPERLRVRPKADVIQPRKHEVTFSQLMDGWALEVKPKPSSIRAYKTRLKFLTDRLGHEVASKVTSDDLRSWRTAMLKENGRKGVPSRETIRDRLAAVATLLRWGFEEDRLKANVASGVKLRKTAADKTQAKAVRDFTAEEMQLILKSARAKTGFLRWAHWICCFTAMRIGEVAQLRPKDVVDEGDGNHHIRVTPEAGSVKSNKERLIPVHSALVDDGFIAFVQAAKGKRLFPELYRNRNQDDAPDKVSQKASALVMRWVRGKAGLGMTDLTIHPTHSVRHYFNSASRDFQLDPEVRKAMVGHMDDRTAEGYGTTSMQAKRQQLEKIKVPNLK